MTNPLNPRPAPTGNAILQEVIDRTRRMEIKLTSLSHQLGVDPTVDCRKVDGDVLVDDVARVVNVSNTNVPLSAVCSAMLAHKLTHAELRVGGRSWGFLEVGK